MLTALSIRDIVLIDALDLDVPGGLIVLTGETGAGKSIILDALGLALGGRGDAGLVRGGAKQGSATAVFSAPDDADLLALLAERGFEVAPGEDLILRRVVGADGRGRAFINDQPAGVAALREIGARLVEVHGQHETVGLLDWKTHRGLLDVYGGLEPQVSAVTDAAMRLKAAEAKLAALRAQAADAAARAEEIALNLAELDALDPRADEETELAGERAILGASEKAVADLADARNLLGGDKLSQRLASALRAAGRDLGGQARGPVVVIAFNAEDMGAYYGLVGELRAAGIAAEVYLGSSGMRPQMKYADRRMAPAAIMLGGDEIAAGTVTVKDLDLGRELSAGVTENAAWREQRPGQQTIPRAELIPALRRILDAQQ